MRNTEGFSGVGLDVPSNQTTPVCFTPRTWFSTACLLLRSYISIMFWCWLSLLYYRYIWKMYPWSKLSLFFSFSFIHSPFLLLLYSLIDIVCLCLLVIIWVGWIPRLLWFCFVFSAICEALWDMTNVVLCLKDCSVWCECTLGCGEVNYLGLNSYFVASPGIQSAGRREKRWVLNWPYIQVTVEDIFSPHLVLICLFWMSWHG